METETRMIRAVAEGLAKAVDASGVPPLELSALLSKGDGNLMRILSGFSDVRVSTIARLADAVGAQVEINFNSPVSRLQSEPIAWEATTPAYTRYITDSRYRRLKPDYQKWYRPYACEPRIPSDVEIRAVVARLSESGKLGYVTFAHEVLKLAGIEPK